MEKFFFIEKYKWRYLAIILHLTYSSYAVFFYSIVGKTSNSRFFMIFSTLIVCGIALLSVNKNEVLQVIYTCLIVVGIYILQYLIFPDNRVYLHSIAKELITYIPFCIFLANSKLDKIYVSLKYVAYILLICNALEPFFRYTIGDDHGYMVYGFRYIPAALIFSLLAFKEKNKKTHLKYWILSVFCFLECFILGNRSILVIYFSFICFYATACTESKERIKWIICFAIMLLIILLMAFTSFLDNVIYLFEHIGIHSRTLSLLKNSEYTGLNGRNILWRNGFEFFKDRPILGYGIGGDRSLILSPWKQGGQYVHNMFFELLLDFGFSGGVLFGVLLFLIILYGYERKSLEYRGLLILFSCLSIPKLMLSGSFWNEPFFWYLLTLIFNKKKLIYAYENEI